MEKYISQKAQKIASALYLVTSFIKDSDVIKWEIREEGISYVSYALTINTTPQFENDQISQLFISSSKKIISFLNISQASGLISSMNSGIIIGEIESLMEFFNKSILENSAVKMHSSGYILSDSFFNTDNNESPLKDKGDSLKTLNTPKNKAIIIKDKKNNRQESIINLLKKDSNLTIKDFVKVIKDCSEKTIQRELINLVEKGLIKRIGERRWSTYSLA